MRILVLFLAFLITAPALADPGSDDYYDSNFSSYYDEDVYTVEDVKVDVKDKNAVEAKKKAVKQAYRVAFEMLMERLLAKEDLVGLRAISDNEIAEYVDGYEVTKQKFSNVRFIGNMTFHFHRDGIQRFLRGYKIQAFETAQAVETSSPLLVVVPIFIDEGQIYLWGDTNPWLKAWSQRIKLSAVTPLQVPYGNLLDLSTVSAQQILAGQATGLNDLARQYGASGTLVVLLRKESPNALEPMSLDITHVTLDGNMSQVGPNLLTTSEGSQSQQFEEAINMVIAQLEEDAKNPNTTRDDDTIHNVVARVSFGSPADWMYIQNTLRNSAIVKQMSLKSLSRSQATVVMTFQGSTSALESALGAKGLTIEQIDGDSWVIRRTGQKTFTTY